MIYIKSDLKTQKSLKKRGQSRREKTAKNLSEGEDECQIEIVWTKNI